MKWEKIFNSFITYIKIYNQKTNIMLTIFPILPLHPDIQSLASSCFSLPLLTASSPNQVCKAHQFYLCKVPDNSPLPESLFRDPCDGHGWSHSLCVSFHVCYRLPESISPMPSHWGLKSPHEAALPQYEVQLLSMTFKSLLFIFIEMFICQ